VVTLGINGKDLSDKFLKKLQRDDSRKEKQMAARIAFVANLPSYQNDENFKHVGEGLYEFKRPGLRLYAFYDQFDDLDDKHQLILCSNGGTKNTKREQQSDIARAKSIKQQYLSAKDSPNAYFTLEKLEEEEEE
jgi:hypothetical protein